MMIINYDVSIKINYNPSWPYIPNHSYKILIIAGSGSGETNALILTNIYLYVKDPFKSKDQLIINGREKVGIKKLKNTKALIEYPQKTDDVYENLEDHNPTKKIKVLIVFDNVIASMEANKKLCPIVTELFLRGRKINILLAFISQSYFIVSKTIRFHTHYFITKIPNKRELQQIASNHSSDIEFKDFIKLYKDYTKE